MLIFLICSIFCGCIFIYSYPKEWPQIPTNIERECTDISGVYTNIDVGGTVSLADVLIKGWYGDKYFPSIRRVQIVQSTDSIVVSFLENGSYIEKEVLLLGEDIFCKDKKLVYSNKGFKAEDVVAAYLIDTYTFQIAEDESIILHVQSSGFGACCLLPMIGTQSKYHLFREMSSYNVGMQVN